MKCCSLVIGVMVLLFGCQAATAQVRVLRNYTRVVPNDGASRTEGPFDTASGSSISVDYKKVVGGDVYELTNVSIGSLVQSDRVGPVSFFQSFGTGSRAFTVGIGTYQYNDNGTLVTVPYVGSEVMGVQSAPNAATRLRIVMDNDLPCNITGKIEATHIDTIGLRGGRLMGNGQIVQTAGFANVNTIIDIGTIDKLYDLSNAEVDAVRLSGNFNAFIRIRNKQEGRVVVPSGKVTEYSGRDTGQLLGDVIVNNGTSQTVGIDRLEKFTNIGDATRTPSITVGYLNLVTGSPSIKANIIIIGNVTSVSAAIQQFETNSFSGSIVAPRIEKLVTQTHPFAIDIASQMSGNLTLSSVRTPVRIGGVWTGSGLRNIAVTNLESQFVHSNDIPADVLITFGSISAAGTFTVGGVAKGLILVNGALSSAALQFGNVNTPGLDGQVIVNASNGSNNWTGNVRVSGGATTITPSGNEYT